MRNHELVALAALAAIGCAANAGPSGAQGSGGMTQLAACSAADNCSHCGDCLSTCNCSTDNSPDCAAACGVEDPSAGGSNFGPPPNDPPPNGGGPGAGGTPGAGGVPGSGGTPNGPPPSGGGGSSACTYPAGPYGTQPGQVVSPNLSWQGYRENESQPSTLSIQDYFDCDGSRGVNAIMLSESAVWCGACQEEANELNQRMSGGWQQAGIRVLDLIIETGSGDPATIQTASAWKSMFDAQSWAVAADPNFSFGSQFGGDGLPLQIVIDPRSMKIVARVEGAGDYTSLEQLAQTNATH